MSEGKKTVEDEQGMPGLNFDGDLDLNGDIDESDDSSDDVLDDVVVEDTVEEDSIGEDSVERAHEKDPEYMPIRKGKRLMDRSVWCTPCQWLQRNTKAAGCDGGKPCSHCVIQMHKRKTTWVCNYEGLVNNSKRLRMPDAYLSRSNWSRWARQHSSNTATSAALSKTQARGRTRSTRSATAGSSASTALTSIWDQSVSSTPARITQPEVIITKQSSSHNATKSPTPRSSNPTPPVTFSELDNPQRFQTPAPSNVPITSIKELISAIRNDISFYELLLDELQNNDDHRNNDVEMKTKLRRYISLLQENLEDEALVTYLDREMRIKGRGLPEEMKKGLLQANFNDCMAKRSWRGAEEEVEFLTFD